MNIIVCIKRVPDTAEAAVNIDSSGKDIVKDRLTFDINESDNYALEEAILLKEKLGGTVTIVSVGPPECEDTLRMGLAKGADTAIRITDEKFTETDGFAIAEILKTAIEVITSQDWVDLILTGCIATDDGASQVGPTLAELMDIPHATLVTKIDVNNGVVRVHRELEGGLTEVFDIKLPALFAIQTGINEPRYASLIAIRHAAAKEIKVLGAGELGIEEVSFKTKVESLFRPPVAKHAEILQGTPEEVSTKLAQILLST